MKPAAVLDKKYLILMGIAMAVIAFAPLPDRRTEPETVTVQIQAESYAFSPGIVEVEKGDTVVLELTSMDVVHGLYLDGYDLSVTSDPGQTARLTFLADETGSFRLRCSTTCGALHPFMIGQLKVGRNDLLWRALAAMLVIGIYGVWSVRRASD
jgi:cytochrome c oxidase subunit 2